MKSLIQKLHQLRSAAAIGLCAGSMMISSAASAFVVYNTGVDSASQVAAAGSVDEHWFLTAGPIGTSGTTQVLTSVSGFPVAPNGPWIGDNGISAWIAPLYIAGTNPGSNVVGSYVYTQTFTLTAGELATAYISGRFALDNWSNNLILNLNNTGISLAFDPAGSDFTQWHQFVINSGFVVGLNTINFYVINAAGDVNGNPSGLRVEIPEPGTLALVGLALLGFGAARRRKQQ